MVTPIHGNETPVGGDDALVICIATAIDEYLAQHPEVGPVQVVTVLTFLTDVMRTQAALEFLSDFRASRGETQKG